MSSSRTHAETAPPGEPDVVAHEPRRLATVCSDLGPELLDVIIAPLGLDVAIDGLAVHDPLDPPGAGLAAGDLVLAVGTAAAEDATAELVRSAGRVGVPAIVCKRRGETLGALVEVAQQAGVALLTTHADAPWGELYGLLRASLSVDVAGDLPRSMSSLTGDLAALADATAAVAEGPITVEDMSGRVLAFSQDNQDVDAARSATILKRRVPTEWMREMSRMGVVARLQESDDVVVVEPEGAQARRVIAVRAGHRLLGAIWLAGSVETLSPHADAALRDAAQIAALHLMRERVFDDLDKRVHGGMLRMLLRGDGLPKPMLSRLGLPPERELLVVAIQSEERAPGAASEPERCASLAAEHLRAYCWHAVATVLDGRTYVLVALHAGIDETGLRRIVGDCATRIGTSLGVGVRAGIAQSARAHDIGIAGARRHADQCLELSSADEQVVTFEQVHGLALLADAQAFLAEQPSGVAPALQLLIEHDRDTGSAHVETLRVYLGVLGDAQAAATALRIHVNTLRYRMRRITQLIALDLADSDERLSLELQLRALPDPSQDG